MGVLFDFNRLITKYSSEYKVIIPSKGDYDDYGDWQEGEPTELTLTGAILSIKESKIHQSEGNLTAEDRVLYALNPLEFALEGAKVVFKGRTYTIEETTENADFTGVWQYTLKHISAFDKGGGDSV